MFQIAQSIENAELVKTNAKKKGKTREQKHESDKDQVVQIGQKWKNRTINLQKFTLLVMNVLKAENRLPEPYRMRAGSSNRRNSNKRCAFHNDIGHLTEDCMQLKKSHT